MATYLGEKLHTNVQLPAILPGARGAALLAGRAYVLPQDAKEIAPDVLRHRIVLSYEAEAENTDTDAVIQRLLAELRTP